MEFLKQVYQTDELVEYILKERASMIHGDNTEEKIFAYIGIGGNGKSKFRELNTLSLGDYCFGFPVTLFTGKRTASNAPSSEVARAKGKRMAFIDEPEENQKLNMGLAKKFSGGDTIETRELYGTMFEFKPQFKMTLICNDPPKVPANDEGTIRRLVCIPHRSKFVSNPKEPHEYPKDIKLTEKIKTWVHVYSSMLVDYYYKYEKEGLIQPACVSSFTDAFLKECDMYEEFFTSSLVRLGPEDADKYVMIHSLYSTFKQWSELNGISNGKAMSLPDFKKYIKKMIKTNDKMTDSKLYGYREREKTEE
jgi:putative DNA primase/helicase